MHPLVAVVMAGCAHEGDARRAREDAVVLDALIEQALATLNRDDFAGLVQRIERILAPWVTNYPAVPLVAFREDARRRLRARAVALWGHAGSLLVQAPLEAIPGVSPGGSILFRR
jgi:hypothetical protein